MAGYREFMPGQVWFYYNMNSSKELEKRKELGACTNRPVVIIQSAFYPEWSDIITVCPMTSSDRRSGVFIDSTILKDGSLVEGGTIMPYLFFNVKTKFLYPLITSSHRRKILSLSPEDFEQVKNGYLYHLGASKEIPQYVENWKHLDDYDRNVIIKDVRLAINDYEEIAYDSARATVDNVVKKTTVNPVLEQTAPETEQVENHIIATLDHFDRNQKMLYSKAETSDSPYAETPIEHTETSEITGSKEVRYDRHIAFTKMDTSSFAKMMGEMLGEFFPLKKNSKVYDGSNCLQNENVSDIPNILSKEDQIKITTLSAGEIMRQTGVNSESTAYRIRKMLRDQDWGELARYDEPSKKMVIEQQNAPEPFRNISLITLSRITCKKNARRREVLLSWDKETAASFVAFNPEGKNTMLELNGIKNVEAVEKDLRLLYPDLFLIEEPQEDPSFSYTEDLCQDETSDSKFAFWDTLSPSEIKEIKSATKKNISAVSKNFGITKDQARSLRGQVLNMVGKSPRMKQTELSGDLLESCVKVIGNKPLRNSDLVIFCRQDPNEIAKIFGSLKCDNTPSKSEIRKLKIAIRRNLVSDLK